MAAWLWLAIVVLIAWGVVGLLQKLSTNHLSGESATIWLIVGFVLFLPFVYPGKAVFHLPMRGIVLGLLSGLINALGAWAILAALRSGGKASVVSPFCALYPIVVVLVAPLILHESINLLQGVGVLCALVAVGLLAS
ncbi:MAG: DMT family transporter [Terriglobia bacterium]|jgi:transporter family protein